MNTAQKKTLKDGRQERLERLIGCYKADLGERLSETKRLFGRKVYAVDIHSHTNYSDGRGTVAENIACAERVGLDFIFITDHASTGQKRLAVKYRNASWGQEPGAASHHIGLLENTRLFKPRRENIADDLAKAGQLAPFVFVPHPAGWYPQVWYSDEQIETLWTLGDSFAVEVMNGANKVVRAYDAFDAKAVEVWDRLLCDGRRVTALGASDAHSPDDVGSVWTGIFAARFGSASFIKALQAGLCFASEASLLDFRADGKTMGSVLRKKRGGSLKLAFRVADSAGIASVRLVSGGKVVKEVRASDDRVCEGTIARKVGAKPAYYRLETTASDDRRAFSTPIYVVPM